MYIYYQRDYYLIEYKIRKENNKFFKSYERKIFKPLSFVLSNFYKDKSYFLLDEDNFVFYTFNIHINSQRSLTLLELKNILNEKIKLINTYYSEKRNILYVYIDNVYVN
jgi:hypothetical protein